MGTPGRRVKMTQEEKERWVVDALSGGRIFISRGDLGAFLESEGRLALRYEFEEHVFLSKPFDKEAEQRMRRALRSVPLFSEGGREGEVTLLFEAFPDQSVEVLHVAMTKPEPEKFTSYYLPPGTSFDLAIKEASVRLKLDKEPWLITPLDFPQVSSQDVVMPGCGLVSSGNGEAGLNGLFPLLKTLLLKSDEMAETRHRAACKGISPVYTLENIKTKPPFKPAPLSWHHLVAHMNDIGLQPSYARGRDVAPTAAIDFALGEANIYPREIRCLADLIYYSLYSFAVKRGQSQLRRCPLCGRLFFADQASEAYCLGYCPEMQEKTCRDAKVQLRTEDGRLKKENAETLEAIRRTIDYQAMEGRCGFDKWPQLQAEYDKFRLGIAEDIHHNAKCREWLKDKKESTDVWVRKMKKKVKNDSSSTVCPIQ